MEQSEIVNVLIKSNLFCYRHMCILIYTYILSTYQLTVSTFSSTKTSQFVSVAYSLDFEWVNCTFFLFMPCIFIKRRYLFKKWFDILLLTKVVNLIDVWVWSLLTLDEKTKIFTQYNHFANFSCLNKPIICWMRVSNYFSYITTQPIRL